MLFPDFRARRLRATKNFRKMIQETKLSSDDLILPLFAVEGKSVKKPIESMPGHFQLSCDNIIKVVKQAHDSGILAVILFGVPDKKDPLGTRAYASDGIVQKAIRAIKESVPDITVITDVCLCGYTDHGHCGVIDKGYVDNDASLDLLARTALSHTQAGADMVAPSDMMDGRVGEIRQTLDEEGFSNIPIMSYAVKYSSAFYGPFRQAAESAPQFGDRKTYQMDPANALEAIREATMDIEEGADIIMVKPALSYLDIIYRLKEEIDLPIAAYNVSGEYSIMKAGEMMGWVDANEIIMEVLLSIKRAGADLILTYSAIEVARQLNN
ncbi:MAG: porphobilinogen synthase [Desulfobacteraceae bacterium]|nr:porphobilinogen synthase [Desulfobacteraceae bacterium]